MLRRAAHAHTVFHQVRSAARLLAEVLPPLSDQTLLELGVKKDEVDCTRDALEGIAERLCGDDLTKDDLCECLNNMHGMIENTDALFVIARSLPITQMAKLLPLYPYCCQFTKSAPVTPYTQCPQQTRRHTMLLRRERRQESRRRLLRPEAEAEGGSKKSSTPVPQE